jgi:hypothetical protein
MNFFSKKPRSSKSGNHFFKNPLLWQGLLIIGILSGIFEVNFYAEHLGKAPETGEKKPGQFRVKSIKYFYLPIGQRNDFISFLLNFFHWRTDRAFIKKELLFEEGEIADGKLLLESEKNLMQTRLFTDVKVQHSVIERDEKNQFQGDVYVMTRDSFSIFGYVDGGVSGGNQWGVLEFGDENFLGKGYLLSFRHYLDFFSKTYAQTFQNPRVLGTHWLFGETMGIQLNSSGQKEGDFQQFTISYPLYSTQTIWGTSLNYTRNNIIVRHTREGELAYLPFTDIRYIYRKLEHNFSFKILRSFGKDLKLDIISGAGGWLEFKNPIDILSASQMEKFQQLLRERSDFFLIFALRLYENNFVRLYNYKSLEISEYLLSGSSLKIEMNPGSGFNQKGKKTFFVTHALKYSFNWILPWKDLIEINASYQSRFNEDGLSEKFLESDSLYSGDASYVIRLAFLGSLFIRISGAHIKNPFYLSPLDSQDQFRGYLYNEFQGDRLFKGLLEMRTIAIRFWYFAVGAILFYEMESLGYNEFPHAIRALGTGLRIMMPEVKSSLIRIDFSYPLDSSDNHYRERFLSLGYFQQF